MFSNTDVETVGRCRHQNAGLSGLLGGMKGLALEECTRRDPTQFHILVVAYRNTAHTASRLKRADAW